MSSRQRFFISIDDLQKARGDISSIAFHGVSPDAFAEALQTALRDPGLWEQWRALQPDPDEVDPGTGQSDPEANVTAKQSDLITEAQVITNLPHAILSHRLGLLIGPHWKLRDVSAV